MSKNNTNQQQDEKTPEQNDEQNSVIEDSQDNSQTSDEMSAESTQSTQDPIEELQMQLVEERGRRLQTMADFENYKKRLDSEKAMFGAIANMGLIREILEVSDDVQLALDDESLSLEAAKDSMKSAQAKITGLVKNAGVEKIEVKKGDDFNKEIMEAIQAIPDPEMVGKVIAVISSAYKYSDREGVIKAAKVIVGK